MATRTNYVSNPSFEVDLTGWAEYNPSASTTSWRDTSSSVGAGGASLRINNAVAADYGRKKTETLNAGTYNISVYAQILAGTTNCGFVVRRADNLNVLAQQNWSSVSNPWLRVDKTFTLSATTTIEILVFVGSYGATSAGSARFDRIQITTGSTAIPYFDGSFADTATINYAWTGTAGLSRSTATDIAATDTPPPTGGTTSPTGWTLNRSTDFDGSSLPSWLDAYDGPSTNGEGDWDPSKVSVANSILKIEGLGLVAGGVYAWPGQKSGRWDVRMRTSNGNYHPVLLLWPDNNNWDDGEIDFSETSNGTSSGVFIHDTFGNPGNNVATANTPLDRTQWHVYSVEWLADRITVKIDGVQVLNYVGANGNPTVPMHLVMQLDMGSHTTPQPYLMEIDWVKEYSPSSTTTPPTTTPPPSTATDPLLEGQCQQVWSGIKHRYIRTDGAVRQREADDKITSEGQAYAAMVAVQLNDRATFDLVEEFSTNTLERKNFLPGFSQNWRTNSANDPRDYAPTLMAWDFRPNPFGGNPADTVYDWNFATDADVDRAKALFWAYARWGDVAYLNKALAICRELKDYGFVTSADGTRAFQITDEFQHRVSLNSSGDFTLDGDGHHLNGSDYVVEMNVSYIDPSLHHLAKDKGVDTWWDKAIAGSWDVLEKVSDSSAPLSTTAGVFPDWNDYTLGSVDDANSVTSGARGWTYTRSTDYKYDAFRTPWRMVWSQDWYADDEVATILAPLADHYDDEWAANSQIAAEYDHSGAALSGGYEKSMMTAGAVMVLKAVNGASDATAAAIVAAKLTPDSLYATDADGFKYWRDAPGGSWSYFGDFWMQFYFLRQAGLWVNWGQTAAPVGGNPVSLEVLDIGTSEDFVEISRPVSLEVLDEGGGIDEVALTGPVALEVLDIGTSLDIADLQSPGTTTGEPPPPAPEVAERERFQWLSPLGLTIELTNFVDSVEVLRGLSGRGAPPSRIKRLTVPGQPGERIVSVTHGSRTLAMPLRAKADDAEALWDLFGTLATHMDPELGDGTLRHIDRYGNKRDLTCRVVGGLEVSDEETFGFHVHNLPVVFYADDPYWYGSPITQGFKGGEATGWFPILPLALGASAVIGDVSLNVGSDVETWPVWTIIGPGSNPVLENTATGQALEIHRDLAVGERLIIDTRPGYKTVIGPDGSNWFPYLVRRSLFPLQPGHNDIHMSLAGATEDSYVSVAYRPRKLVPA